MVNEQMSPKFWWLDPSGKMHPVPGYEHWNWALAYLMKHEGFLEDEVKDNVYGFMLKLGWSRVAAFEYGGEKAIEYDVNKDQPLTQRQMKELKDTAIEMGIEKIIRHPYDVSTVKILR